jgi:hypothetical protein
MPLYKKKGSLELNNEGEGEQHAKRKNKGLELSDEDDLYKMS